MTDAQERLRPEIILGEPRPGEGHDGTALEQTRGVGRQIGDHRSVPGRAYREGHRRRALDGDDLLAGREAGGAVRDQVAGRILGIDALDEQVLDVGAGVGEAPGDPAIVPQHDTRHAGHAGADQLDLRRPQMRKIPVARRAQAQVRIVGKKRRAGGRATAGDDPGIGADAAGRRRWQGGRQLVPGQRARHLDQGGRRILRIVRPDVGDLLVRQALGEPGAEQLVTVVDAEIQRHQPQPDQAVRRPPRLQIGVAEDEELRRQRSGPALEESIDAAGVGLQPGDRRRLEVREARFRQAVQAEGAHEAVARERSRAEDLGEPAGAETPAELHLPEPVLGVREAKAEGRIQQTRGLDVRDREAVAHDGHRRPEPGHLDVAVEPGQRLPQPPVAAAQPGRDQHDEAGKRPAEPAQQAAHVSASPIGRADPGERGRLAVDRHPGRRSHPGRRRRRR